MEMLACGIGSVGSAVSRAEYRSRLPAAAITRYRRRMLEWTDAIGVTVPPEQRGSALRGVLQTLRAPPDGMSEPYGGPSTRMGGWR